MARVIVTGGAGFIGSHLAEFLTKEHQVFVLDDLSGGFAKNVPVGPFFELIDLKDKNKVNRLISEIHPDVVFHLAADATEGRSQFTPVLCTENNYNTTLNLLTACLKTKVKKFVFTSSMAVYGNQPVPYNEDMLPLPVDIYGIAKASAESAIKVLGHVHDIDWTIIRPHNVYGPRQNMSDPYRNVIAIFMNKFLKKEPIYIYGDGLQTRAFSYVTDLIPYIAQCGFNAGASEQIYNMGSDRYFTILELADLIEEISGISVKREFLLDRPLEVKEAYCVHHKVKHDLNFQDQTSLKEGLTHMWEWAVQHGSQKTKYISCELESENMPTTWRSHLI